jgi:hypothetical protein
MATVTTRYVIYASRRRRHGGGGLIDIQPSGNSNLANGDTYQVPPGFPIIPWTDSNNQVHNLHFAFWSVVGGTDGPVLSFAGDPSPSVPVGSQNIAATAWYVDLGVGDGTGDNRGIIIDAFDANIGDFVFDDFVTCTPGDAAFNTNANWDGFVPTATAETINAFGSIHGVPFVDWHVAATIVPTITPNNAQLQASAGSIAFAFAFYKTTKTTIPGIDKNFREGTWVSWGVMVDGGGPTGNGPVGPWDPTLQEFAAGMALMELAGKVNDKLAGDVMSMAAKQVQMAADAMAAKMKAPMQELRKK